MQKQKVAKVLLRAKSSSHYDSRDLTECYKIVRRLLKEKEIVRFIRASN